MVIYNKDLYSKNNESLEIVFALKNSKNVDLRHLSLIDFFEKIILLIETINFFQAHFQNLNF